MARLDDMEQINLELDAFRARLQDTFTKLDQLADLILELSKLKEDLESKLQNASGSEDKLDQFTTEVESKWSVLEQETRKILEQLKDVGNELHGSFDKLKQENDQRWTKIQEDLTKAQNGLQIALDLLKKGVEQSLNDLEIESDNRYEEINHNLDAHSSQLDEFKQENDQRWTKIQEDLTKAQNDLMIADRNLRIELGRMINELGTASEGRFSEINSSIENQRIRFEEKIRESDNLNETTHLRLSSDIETSRQEFERSSQSILQQISVANNRISELKRWLFIISVAILILIIFTIHTQIKS
jgi:chromosome segregation ATPase